MDYFYRVNLQKKAVVMNYLWPGAPELVRIDIQAENVGKPAAFLRALYKDCDWKYGSDG